MVPTGALGFEQQAKLCPRQGMGANRCPTPRARGPNKMREKITRYEAAGRGILSIKDAFYLAVSSSPSYDPPSSSWPLPRPLSRHVAAASYFVLPKGYFSRHRCCPSSFIPVDSPTSPRSKELSDQQRLGITSASAKNVAQSSPRKCFSHLIGKKKRRVYRREAVSNEVQNSGL